MKSLSSVSTNAGNEAWKCATTMYKTKRLIRPVISRSLSTLCLRLQQSVHESSFYIVYAPCENMFRNSLWATAKNKNESKYEIPLWEKRQRSMPNFLSEFENTTTFTPRMFEFFLGYEMINLLFLSLFSFGRTSTSIISTAVVKEKPWAPFKSRTRQRSHILSALQRLLASC